jgi:hypothetical protein
MSESGRTGPKDAAEHTNCGVPRSEESRASKLDRYLAGGADHFSAERGTPECDAAWALLAAHIRDNGLGDGTDLLQEHGGEVWQYMGSARDAAGEVHCFRHRRHATTESRIYAHV